MCVIWNYESGENDRSRAKSLEEVNEWKVFFCFITCNYIYIFRDTNFLLIWIWLKCVCVFVCVQKKLQSISFLLFGRVQEPKKNTIVEESGAARQRYRATIAATMMTTTTTMDMANKDEWMVLRCVALRCASCFLSF